jgi:cyclophilin family peptidyl-prolyl cis-trans isomerase
MLSTFRSHALCAALLAAVSWAAAPACRAEGGSDAAKAASAKGGDVAVKQVEGFIASQKIDTKKPGWKTQLPRPPKATFDDQHTYYWNLDTSVGGVKVKLLPKSAPMHVTSTIYLTELGFYDGLPFHRVIPRFMAQGGDPLGRGTGGPGYQYGSEIDSKLKHDKPGMLSMANTGQPNTDGSQFFLTFVATPWLDGKHTIFGEVVEGLGTLQELERRGTQSGQPREEILIRTARITVE